MVFYIFICQLQPAFVDHWNWLPSWEVDVYERYCKTGATASKTHYEW
jgi:hypothetical protein